MQRPEKGFSKDQKKVLKGRPWTTAQQGEKVFERTHTARRKSF
jgi:hypothetical protein